MKWLIAKIKDFIWSWKWHRLCNQKGREITAKIKEECQNGIMFGYKKDENGHLTPRSYEEMIRGA